MLMALCGLLHKVLEHQFVTILLYEREVEPNGQTIGRSNQFGHAPLRLLIQTKTDCESPECWYGGYQQLDDDARGSNQGKKSEPRPDKQVEKLNIRVVWKCAQGTNPINTVPGSMHHELAVD